MTRTQGKGSGPRAEAKKRQALFERGWENVNWPERCHDCGRVPDDLSQLVYAAGEPPRLYCGDCFGRQR